MRSSDEEDHRSYTKNVRSSRPDKTKKRFISREEEDQRKRRAVTSSQESNSDPDFQSGSPRKPSNFKHPEKPKPQPSLYIPKKHQSIFNKSKSSTSQSSDSDITKRLLEEADSIIKSQNDNRKESESGSTQKERSLRNKLILPTKHTPTGSTTKKVNTSSNSSTTRDSDDDPNFKSPEPLKPCRDLPPPKLSRKGKKSKLILPRKKKQDDTSNNDDTNSDDIKLDDSERDEIIKRLEKTHRKEQATVFTCPFCLTPFKRTNKTIQNALDKFDEEERLYKQKVKEENKHSSFKKPDELIKRPIASSEKEAFCRLHTLELVIRPKGEKRGYPFDIDFEGIRDRIMAIRMELEDVIHKRIPSDYRKVVLDAYDSLGANKARTPMMMMTRFELLSPGYYGPRGAAVILDVLTDLFLKSGELPKHLIAPQMPLEYVQQVLIPETAYRLIRQDIIRKHKELKTGKPLANANGKAKEIMLESCQFGEVMYPLIDEKDDMVSPSEKPREKNDTITLD